ncbi:glycosyl hydrolase family 18 protein [Curtobacterium flaccumfaciens]|nr:glycosyl hydrolase family 18 protein [Curtobacterium flaccumfaciens]
MAIIFAANINWNGSKAVLYNNDKVQATLDAAATQIRPLQAKGIKVSLSILGNHQGAGIANFPTQAAAQDFASQVTATVTKYGLDGVDLDDEYADYGTNGTRSRTSSRSAGSSRRCGPRCPRSCCRSTTSGRRRPRCRRRARRSARS